MNTYQRLIVVVALIDVAIILLFPPFLGQPMARAAFPEFDGFYPIFSQLGRKPLFKELLSLQLIFVGINALSAWLALADRRPTGASRVVSYWRGIAIFAAVNTVVIFAFPPFEPWRTLLRGDIGGFDGFYFVFGRNRQPPIYWPLLQLECLFIAINALALGLLFGAVSAKPAAAAPQAVPAPQLPASGAAEGDLGRGPERRQRDVGPPNDERRSGRDRRAAP